MPSDKLIVAPSRIVIKDVPKKKGNKKKRKNKKGGKRNLSTQPGGRCRDLVLAFFKSLVNPFDNCGVRLGWGNFAPSTIVSAVLRTSLPCNSTDGSMALCVIPSANSSLWYNVGGASSATWNQAACSNQGAIGTSCSEGRVISFGVRAFPSIPMTSAPGVVYSGAMAVPNTGSLNLLTPNGISALPTSHLSIGIAGGSATGRPLDPDSYSFFQSPIQGYTTGTTLTHTCPYLVFTGLPSNTPVFIEVVVNIEATTAVTSASILPDDTPLASDNLASYYPSLESLWAQMSAILPAPGRPGEATAASDDSFISAMLGAVNTGARQAGRGFMNGMISSVIGGSMGSFSQSYPQQYSGYLR